MLHYVGGGTVGLKGNPDSGIAWDGQASATRHLGDDFESGRFGNLAADHLIDSFPDFHRISTHLDTDELTNQALAIPAIITRPYKPRTQSLPIIFILTLNQTPTKNQTLKNNDIPNLSLNIYALYPSHHPHRGAYPYIYPVQTQAEWPLTSPHLNGNPPHCVQE